VSGPRSSKRIEDLEQAVAEVEASLEPLFAAGRYRDFFARVHNVRQSFKTSRLPAETRERLWHRLNQCAEAAKARQIREFAIRNEQHLARWRAQLETAQHYAAALTDEITELDARRGPQSELAIWQRRAAEKRARLAGVQTHTAELRRKIADVAARSTLSS
jgi:predicted  nucleic acid-binding Zn-ribbon protein